MPGGGGCTLSTGPINESFGSIGAPAGLTLDPLAAASAEGVTAPPACAVSPTLPAAVSVSSQPTVVVSSSRPPMRAATSRFTIAIAVLTPTALFFDTITAPAIGIT